MFSEGLPRGLRIFRGRFMAEVCMMKQVRFHLNFRYEDSVVSRRVPPPPPSVFACYQRNVFFSGDNVYSICSRLIKSAEINWVRL